MSTDERLPRCVVCRKSRTGDAYERADEEIERLENNGVYGVARVKFVEPPTAKRK